MRTGAVEHGVGMGCAARKSQKPALEIGGWAGGAQVPCFCLQVCADNGEVWGGYGGRVRSVALATTRGCSAFVLLPWLLASDEPSPKFTCCSSPEWLAGDRGPYERS